MDIERLREQWERITHEGLMNGIPCREIVDALLATETGQKACGGRALCFPCMDKERNAAAKAGAASVPDPGPGDGTPSAVGGLWDTEAGEPG